MTDTRDREQTWPAQISLAGQTHVATGPIDLRNMYIAHHAFRRDLESFESAVRHTPVGAADAWQALQELWALFAEVLHHHHTIEDVMIWPVLLAHTAEAADHTSTALLHAMEAEHDLIDPALEACAAGFAAMTTHPCVDHRNALDVHVTTARELLLDHLRHEENEALPLLQRLMTHEEWQASEAFAMKDISLAKIRDFVPWSVRGLTEEQLADYLDHSGAVLRLLLRLFTGRYERRERRAFRYASVATASPRRRSSTGRRLAWAMAALLVVDLVGGLLAVASGVNTWAEAWGGKALLAAPVPMIVVQILLTWVAVTRRGRAAVVAAGVLALACLVSVVSGFFDGGLANDSLDGPLVAFQVFLLLVTGVVGGFAVARAAELVKARS